jgi:hypothetical protein
VPEAVGHDISGLTVGNISQFNDLAEMIKLGTLVDGVFTIKAKHI